MPGADDVDGRQRHVELMRELRTLRAMIEPREQIADGMLEAYKAQIAEAAKLKKELDLITEAITKTKHEIATVHVSGFNGPEMTRVTHELDAIVGGTEQATQHILHAAEEIDQSANALAAGLKNSQYEGMADDIQDKVIRIFEACNFQDLTGQRITRVVSTLKFIEEHVNKMMEIWGGMQAFEEFAPDAFAEAQGDAKLLNGPKLDGEDGHVSQDDIDALFN